MNHLSTWITKCQMSEFVFKLYIIILMLISVFKFEFLRSFDKCTIDLINLINN